MPRRSLVFCGNRLPVFLFLSAAVFVSPLLAVAQGTPTGQSYTAPRTPDGQPDLQGFWSNQTYTRLERPNGVDKEFSTPEEVAAWVAWRTPDRLTVCGSERFSFEFSEDYYCRFGTD